MGLWDLLKNINNAEGIREAMRMSYNKHFKLAMNGKIPLNNTTPHRIALYGALASRFRLSGVPVDNVTAEALIWADLLPFLYLDQHTACEALAEYVVYKEMPKDAKISWLTTLVQKGCQVGKDSHQEEYDTFITVAKANVAVWLLLFEGRGNDYFWGDRW
jgi:hypothetical protein